MGRNVLLDAKDVETQVRCSTRYNVVYVSVCNNI